MKVKLTLIDVTAETIKAFGEEGANALVAELHRALPETDWRWHIEYDDGGECTFGYQETAAHVAEYMREKGWEL